MSRPLASANFVSHKSLRSSHRRKPIILASGRLRGGLRLRAGEGGAGERRFMFCLLRFFSGGSFKLSPLAPSLTK